MSSILIIGADPTHMDFSAPGTPPGVNADFIRNGLNGSRDRLVAAGHAADILWTGDETTIAGEAEAAFAGRAYDIIVIGAGLRTLPPMAEQFELLMNVVHARAPRARLAFNSTPGDSDVAALRQLVPG